MKSAKLGAMFLVSVLALAGIGMSYAAWTDTIYIAGTVNTGSVGWEFTTVSGTEVWKVWGTNAPINETYVRYCPEMDPVSVAFPDSYAEGKTELISYATVVATDDHHAVVTYDNLFPCIEFEADVTILYTGTVPGKINGIVFTDEWASDATEPTYADEVLLDQYTTLDVTVCDAQSQPVMFTDYLGLQLHQGYTIHIVMKIHLPQDNTLMSLNGDFGVSAQIVQWNEYPYI